MPDLDTLRRQYCRPCVYCGEPADTRDHVPPKSVSLVHKTYDACRQCNCQILHGHVIYEIELRAQFVAEWLMDQVSTTKIRRRIKHAREVASGVREVRPRGGY